MMMTMSGNLHVFCRHVANGGDIYQVNYTTVGSTFAKVFGSAHELREFLLTEAGLEESAIEGIWRQIARGGTATLEQVEMSPQQAVALGMTHASIDF